MSEKVIKYYQSHTRKFLKFGTHFGSKNIHQALWPNGIKNKEEASNYSNSLILKELKKIIKIRSLESKIKVFDLGCGVGSSVFYLASKLKPEIDVGIDITGVSISSVQIEIANIEKQKLQILNVGFLECDYLELPNEWGNKADLVYSIEAFVHASNPSRYFEQVGKILKKDALLILVDDFLVNANYRKDGSIKKNLKKYQEGWCANSLLTVNELSEIAATNSIQFESYKSLKEYMRLGRPRDKAIGLCESIFGEAMWSSSYGKSLIGGFSKQKCLKNDWMDYGIAIFKKI